MLVIKNRHANKIIAMPVITNTTIIVVRYRLKYVRTVYTPTGVLMVTNAEIPFRLRLGVRTKPITSRRDQIIQNTRLDCVKLQLGTDLNAIALNKFATIRPQPKSSMPYSIKLFGRFLFSIINSIVMLRRDFGAPRHHGAPNLYYHCVRQLRDNSSSVIF